MKVATRRRAHVIAGLAGFTWSVFAPVAGLAGSGSTGTLSDPANSAESGMQALADQLLSLGLAGGEVAELIRACRAAAFTETEVHRVLRLIVRAKLAGLPHTALLNKLREGLAKRAPPEAIEAAIEKRAQTLRQAKGLTDLLVVEGWGTADYGLSIQMVADALEAGAGPAAILRSVREDTGPQPGVPDVRMVFRRISGAR